MYMFMYNWNQYNILNQLYYNKSFKKEKKEIKLRGDKRI